MNMKNEIDYNQVERFWSETVKKFPKEELYLVGGNFYDLEDARLRHKCELRHFLKKVPLDNEKEVLEMASGSGRWTISLAPLVKHITAVDISADQIEIAKEEARRRKIDNIDFIVMNSVDFIPAKRYDIIHIAGLTQYVGDSDLRNIVLRLKNCLKENGLVISRDTVNTSKRTEIGGNYPCIYRTKRELVSLFAEAGFSLIYDRESYFHYFYTLIKYFREHIPFLYTVISKPYYSTFYYIESSLLPLYGFISSTVKYMKFAFSGFKRLNGRNHKFFIFKTHQAM